MTAQPLSRRDRASLQLAYECVRTRWAYDANEEVFDARAAIVLADHGAQWKHRLADAVDWARFASDDIRSRRLVRARLALLLRAILRADAGDYGEWWVWIDPEDGEEFAASGRTVFRWFRLHGGSVRRITPLWELAAARKAAP